MIEYKPKLSIKELFKAEGLLNQFGYIVFEDIDTFVSSIKQDFFKTKFKHIIELPINTLNSFNKMIKIFEETEITATNYFRLVVPRELLFQLLPTKIRTSAKFELVYESNNIDFSINDLMGMKKICLWLQNNPLTVRVKINRDNYTRIFNDLPAFYNLYRFRLFDLTFDYTSFDSITISELRKLEFWINHFNSWYMSSGDKNNRGDLDIQIRIDNNIFKKVYVTKDFKLYLTKQQFIEQPNDYLFDLAKNKQCNGEEVPYKELNKLRQYLDFNPIMLLTQFKPRMINGFLMDFYQNKKIMGNICELPLIVILIMDWLTVGPDEMYNDAQQKTNRVMCKEMMYNGEKKCIEQQM
jgi:hypothetical protein